MFVVDNGDEIDTLAGLDKDIKFLTTTEAIDTITNTDGSSKLEGKHTHCTHTTYAHTQKPTLSQ